MTSSGDGDNTTDREFKRNTATALVPALAALAFAFAGLIGSQVLAKLATVESKVEELQIDVAVIKTDIQYIKQQQSAQANP